MIVSIVSDDSRYNHPFSTTFLCPFQVVIVTTKGGRGLGGYSG